MKTIIKKHSDLNSAEKIYSAIKNFETVTKRNLPKIVNQRNKFPCFKKVRNDEYFKMLREVGMITECFVSYYDLNVEPISRRQLLNVVALRDYLINSGKTEDEASSILAYTLALYFLRHDDARKEFFFLMFFENKSLPKKDIVFTYEVNNIPNEIKDFVFYKTSIDEDGDVPHPTAAGLDFVNGVSNQTIIIDIEKRLAIQNILEANVNIAASESEAKPFVELAKILEIELT